jgi:hypothetical protein
LPLSGNSLKSQDALICINVKRDQGCVARRVRRNARIPFRAGADAATRLEFSLYRRMHMTDAISLQTMKPGDAARITGFVTRASASAASACWP